MTDQPHSTTWIHGRPVPDMLDPDNWSDGLPRKGSEVRAADSQEQYGEIDHFPPEGCKNTWALKCLRFEFMFARRGWQSAVHFRCDFGFEETAAEDFS